MKVTHKIGKPKLKGKAKIFDIVKNSYMEVSQSDNKILITIAGEAAVLPSMKNSKLPKSNFSNPNFLLRVKALDILFKSSYRQSENIFGTQTVHLLVVNAKRNRQYDPIGTLETIQDWLEPDTKPVGRAKRHRGWGVGLIENDSQVVGLSLKGDTDKTTILIQPYENVENFVNDFISKLKGAKK